MELCSFKPFSMKSIAQITKLVAISAFFVSSLPSVKCGPVANFDSYYNQPASYDSRPYDQPIYEPPAPAYRRQEDYRPSPPIYNRPPPREYYARPRHYQKEYVPNARNYEAVRYQELNVSLNCGLLAAVNADLYTETFKHQDYEKSYIPYGTALLVKDDVVPFGLYPWVVQITDDNNNYLCAGTVVHNRQILTLASCIQDQSLEKLRVRYRDWDLLNDVNEFEAYKNYETRICRTLPMSCPSSSSSYNGQNYYSPDTEGQLILLQVNLSEDYDKYPQTKPICLPEWTSVSTPSYAPPPPPTYSPPVYSSPQAYLGPAAYSNPMYAAPIYSPPLSPDYSECWVEGYSASPSVELKNHQPPQLPVVNDGFSYPAKDYSPFTTPEQSKIPRRAQVKRVQASSQPPQYGYQSPPTSECDEEQQWIGVNGYDVCVADKGSAIICIVTEKQGSRDATYQNDDSSFIFQNVQPPQYDTYPSCTKIKAASSPAKESRQRAVVVAIVKTVTDCTNYDQSPDSSYSYDQQQSKSITAVKVTSDVVSFVVDKFWEGALDYSCPAQKSSVLAIFYPENPPAPSYQPPFYGPPPTYSGLTFPNYSPPQYNPLVYGPPPAYSEPSYISPPYFKK